MFIVWSQLFDRPCSSCTVPESQCSHGNHSAFPRSSLIVQAPHHPTPSPLLPLPPLLAFLLPQPQPTPVIIQNGLDNTLEYAIEEADIPECAGILVNAVVQTLHPALPNPFIRIKIVGTFSALIDRHSIFLIFEVASGPHPHTPPPPLLPAYPDSPA